MIIHYLNGPSNTYVVNIKDREKVINVRGNPSPLNHVVSVAASNNSTDADIIASLQRQLKLTTHDDPQAPEADAWRDEKHKIYARFKAKEITEEVMIQEIDAITKTMLHVEITDLSDRVDINQCLGLAKECFKPEFQSTVSVMGDKCRVDDVTYNPNNDLPRSIKTIMDKVWTPEVIQAYRNANPPERKKKMETIITDKVQIVDGKAILTKVTTQRPVTKLVPLFLDDGVTPVIDPETKIQKTIEAPVYEDE